MSGFSPIAGGGGAAPDSSVGPWQNLIVDPEWVGNTIRYRLLNGVKNLQMVGSANRNLDPGAWVRLGILPSGFRPAKSQFLVIYAGVDPAYDPAAADLRVVGDDSGSLYVFSRTLTIQVIYLSFIIALD